MSPARTSNPSPPPRASSSNELEAMLARMTPVVLALLADGVPRSRATIIAALGPSHAKEDLRRTLMRLAVTGQLVETDRKYRLPDDAAASV